MVAPRPPGVGTEPGLRSLSRHLPPLERLAAPRGPPAVRKGSTLDRFVITDPASEVLFFPGPGTAEPFEAGIRSPPHPPLDLVGKRSYSFSILTDWGFPRESLLRADPRSASAARPSVARSPGGNPWGRAGGFARLGSPRNPCRGKLSYHSGPPHPFAQGRSLQPSTMEFVYVVPREVLFPTCTPQGFLPFPSVSGAGSERSGEERGEPGHLPWADQDGFHRLVRDHGFFVERARAERTPSWKQIIPYTLLSAEGRVLLVRRKKAGGESRLHDKLSIGIGGHVDSVDALRAAELGEMNPLAAGSRRELEEEVHIQGPFQLSSLGLLNDDSNPVGAVHLGLVQVAEIDGTVQVREEDILDGRMVSTDELGALLTEGANFETWSAILAQRIQTLLPTPITTT